VTGQNGKEMTMDARLDYLSNTLVLKLVKHLNAAAAALHDSGLPAATQELVKLRASQINGCGFCTDMHIKDALHVGESQQRLNLVAAWREAKVFTEAERAALELAEQGTCIADAAGGVTDDAWANAAKHYDDDQLAALVAVIGDRENTGSRDPGAGHAQSARRSGPGAARERTGDLADLHKAERPGAGLLARHVRRSRPLDAPGDRWRTRISPISADSSSGLVSHPRTATDQLRRPPVTQGVALDSVLVARHCMRCRAAVGGCEKGAIAVTAAAGAVQ
jgi:AhpD family alkylhydroperoxidase